MITSNRRLTIAVLGWCLLMPAARVTADCVNRADGQVIKLEVASCEAIVAEKNRDVLEHAGSFFETWNLKRAYTGALIKDNKGTLWMYPTAAPDPCNEIRRGTAVEKKAYYTCCDSGRWGKCVFGGNWLGDVAGRPINSFQ